MKQIINKKVNMIEKIETGWNANVGVPMNDKPTLIHRDEAMLMFHLMNEELLEYKLAVNKIVQKLDDLEDLTYEDSAAIIIEIADALADLQYLILGTVCQFGLHKKFDDIMEEVYRSNMTKLQDGKLIKRSDGKVLKPSTYSPPNIGAILKK